MHFHVNKMTLRNIGEVALRDKSPTGIGYSNKVGKNIEETSIPRHFIININSIGTGFIINKLINPFYVIDFCMYAVALIVTAGHAICDVIDSTNKLSVLIECNVDGYNEEFSCFVLKTYHEKFDRDALSSNGTSFCVGEGDLALLLLLANSDSLFYNEPNVDSGTSLIGDECFVAGYPSGLFFNLLHNYPFTDDKDDAKLNLEKIFQEPTSLICSPGQVKWIGQIIEITCSTCKGMSGSPVLRDNSIIGILVGGPTLFGQRELFNAAKCLVINDVSSSWMHFYDFTRYQDLYNCELGVKMMRNSYTCLFENAGINSPQELSSNLKYCNYESIKRLVIPKLIDMISSLVIKLKDKSSISHNSALPTNGIAFQELINDAQNFKSRLHWNHSDLYLSFVQSF